MLSLCIYAGCMVISVWLCHLVNVNKLWLGIDVHSRHCFFVLLVFNGTCFVVVSAQIGYIMPQAYEIYIV